MSEHKGLVLDANILLRAVFGRRVLEILEKYEDGADWASSQGCVEMASDTWIDNIASQRVHEALNFEVVDRCVHYRKAL